MTEDELKKLETELKGSAEAVKKAIEQRDEELKNYKQVTETTAAELKKAGDRLVALETEKKELEARLGRVEAAANRPGGEGQKTRLLTPGQQFVMSEEFKAAQASRATVIPFVEVKDFFSRKADPIVGDGQPNSPVAPQRVPEIFFDPGQRTLTLRDLMNAAPTNSNTIEYVLEQTFDPDDAGAQGGEGGTKSQGGMTFLLKSAAVATIAHWVAISRQALADSAQLQSHIDNRLTYSIQKELEDQILFGDGADGNLLGIHNTPGVVTVGAPTGTDTYIDHIRKAIAAVRASEYQATGIILNPADWATIELTKGDDDHYIWVNVSDGGVPRLWRVPVIETTAMEEKRFLTGAFGLGAQLWDRQQAQIRVSESHDTYFVKNLVALLGELRMAITTYRPKAFIKGTLDGTVST